MADQQVVTQSVGNNAPQTAGFVNAIDFLGGFSADQSPSWRAITGKALNPLISYPRYLTAGGLLNS